MSDEGDGEGRAGLSGGAIASIAGVGALAIFILQNTEDVRLDFLVLHFTWPLWLLVIVSALLGALVWFGLGVMRRHRRRQERRASDATEGRRPTASRQEGCASSRPMGRGVRR